MFMMFGGGRKYLPYRLAIIAVVVLAVVVFHLSGSASLVLRLVMYAALFGAVGATGWRQRRRSQTDTGLDGPNGRSMGGFGGYRYGPGVDPVSPSPGLPAPPPSVTPLDPSVGPSVAPLEASQPPPSGAVTPGRAVPVASESVSVVSPFGPASSLDATTSLPPSSVPVASPSAAGPIASAAAVSIPPPPVPVARAAAQPPGWYRDPTNEHIRHYWDGIRWTQSVQWDGASWVPATWGTAGA